MSKRRNVQLGGVGTMITGLAFGAIPSVWPELLKPHPYLVALFAVIGILMMVVPWFIWPSTDKKFNAPLEINSVTVGGDNSGHQIVSHGGNVYVNHPSDLSAPSKQTERVKSSIPSRIEWLNLADRFSALSSTYADWYTARGNTTWSLSDTTVRSLCKMAGTMLLESQLIQYEYPILLSEVDPAHRWLSYIKVLKSSERILHSEEDLDDGSKLLSHMGLVEVPKNSADICIELAAQSGGRI